MVIPVEIDKIMKIRVRYIDTDFDPKITSAVFVGWKLQSPNFST